MIYEIPTHIKFQYPKIRYQTVAIWNFNTHTYDTKRYMKFQYPHIRYTKRYMKFQCLTYTTKMLKGVWNFKLLNNKYKTFWLTNVVNQYCDKRDAFNLHYINKDQIQIKYNEAIATITMYSSLQNNDDRRKISQ